MNNADVRVEPCPFCKNKDLKVIRPYLKSVCYVFCPACGAQGPKQPTRALAIAAHSTCTASAQVAELKAERDWLKVALRIIAMGPCEGHEGCDGLQCVCPRGIAVEAIARIVIKPNI